MSLANLMEIANERGQIKQGMSEERLDAVLPELRYTISFYREYPDLLVDEVKGPNSTFHFYFYQRIFLRVVMRHRYVYMTFPRAFSKSFLSMMALMLRSILYPNSNLFVTTGGKIILFITFKGGA